ncbi:unnamed protein product [Schistosoma turkestanicum]|nr:unnamed protein product [Schistosoma turkestanicum]
MRTVSLSLAPTVFVRLFVRSSAYSVCVRECVRVCVCVSVLSQNHEQTNKQTPHPYICTRTTMLFIHLKTGNTYSLCKSITINECLHELLSFIPSL